MKRFALVFLGSFLLIAALACGGGTAPTPTPRPAPTPTFTPGVSTPRTPSPTPRPGVTPTTPSPIAATTPAPSGDLVQRGKQVFLKGGTTPCTACHKIQGVPEAVGTLGPDLTHVGTEAAKRKPGTSAEAYIIEALKNPNAFVVPGFAAIMPPDIVSNLSDDDFKALVAYLLSLK